MALTESIRITKSFAYRGSTKLWSNRYHLDPGHLPPTDAQRSALLDAVSDREQGLFYAAQTIVKGEYFLAGTDVPQVVNAYAKAGTGAFANSRVVPGDVALVVRYSTTQRTSKNHPIYLFNYYHGVRGDTTLTEDDANTDQAAAFLSYAEDWVSGFVYGGGAYEVVRAGPNGAVAQVASVLPYLRHRDFT